MNAGCVLLIRVACGHLWCARWSASCSGELPADCSTGCHGSCWDGLPSAVQLRGLLPQQCTCGSRRTPAKRQRCCPFPLPGSPASWADAWLHTPAPWPQVANLGFSNSLPSACRPGLQERARYYAVVYLNQMVLNHKQPAQTAGAHRCASMRVSWLDNLVGFLTAPCWRVIGRHACKSGCTALPVHLSLPTGFPSNRRRLPGPPPDRRLLHRLQDGAGRQDWHSCAGALDGNVSGAATCSDMQPPRMQVETRRSYYPYI